MLERNKSLYFFGEFDSLDPLEKYNRIQKLSYEPMIISTILALKSIDDLFLKLYGKPSLYVLGDQSIKRVFEKIDLDFHPKSILPSCKFLMISQLIYRFTAARKFRISDSSIKQLRINSWGHILAEEIAHKDRPLSSKIKNGIEQLVTADLKIYSTLASHLRDDTKINAEIIKKLNANLTLRVVS